MKILAAISNFVLLGLFCYILSTDGVPKTSKDVLIFSIFILTPLINLAALFFSGITKDWLSLYLKRKALEEQQKIDKLAQKDDHQLK